MMYYYDDLSLSSNIFFARENLLFPYVIALNNFISKRKELSIPNTKRKESEMGKRSNQKKENKREVLS